MWLISADSSPDDADISTDNQSDFDLNDLHEDSDHEEGEKPANETGGMQKIQEEISQPLTETTSNNIPLQRIVVSVKHQKRRSSKVLKQGWMIHYTDRDDTVCGLVI